RMMVNRFYLGFIFALLLGCQGGWDKNPRLEGLPPEVKQEAPAHMNAVRESMFILNDLEYEFVEGQEDATVEFDVKVLQEDIAEIRAEIPRLEDYLPGATQSYDPTTSKLTVKWDVPDIFVRGIPATVAEYELKVVVYTRSLNGSESGREGPIRFKVLRKYERPEIVSVELTKGTGTPIVKEGSSVYLTAVVRDP